MSLLLQHRDLGGTGKPPLLLFHGLLGSSRNWQTAGGDLAAWFHVLALDLRNHGRSPHADGMNYALMMEDVLAWMDGRGIAQAAMLGHSMGGKVAMLLACRRPERVSRLVVVDIAPKEYLSEAHRAEFAAMNELDLRSLKSRGEAELRFEARVADWSMRKFLSTNLERQGEADAGEAGQGWKWTINLPVLTASLPLLEANPLSEYDHFDGPALFLKGERSRYIDPAKDLPRIQRHFPRATLTEIAGSGHNPHMEARPVFVEAVRSFLAS